MKRLGVRRDKVAAAAVALGLLAAGGTLSFAVTAGAAPEGALQETTVSTPTDTGPTPDPAPAPAPAPKPAPKPTAPTPTHRTYTAPRRHTAPRNTHTAPTYTPPRATVRHSSAPPHVTRKHSVVVHKKKKPVAHAVTTTAPAETTPKPALLAPVGAKTRSSSGGDHAITSVLFIAGVTFAALLFLLAATVPGTPARFTSVGRIVFEHQQDLVLVGLAAFLVTVFVYVLTGHGL